MRKILIGYLPENSASGIATYLMSVKEILSENNVQCDFLTSANLDENFKKIVLSQKSKIYQISNLTKPIAHIRDTRNAIRNDSYDAIYLNISEALNSLGIIAAKKEKIPKIIVHSHSSGIDRKSKLDRKIRYILHCFGKKFLIPKATDFFACSSKAMEWMYPSKIINTNKVYMIHNSVDYKKYEFNPFVRNEIREQYHCDGKTIVGFVGSFSYQKNIFQVLRIAEKLPNEYQIWMLGTGEYFNEFKAQLEARKLNHKIILFGKVDNVAEMLQAMDCFILPSRFEGLPFVAIEAQAAGLPTLLSDTIARESKITKDCWFIDNQRIDKWIQIIEGISYMNRSNGKAISGYDKFCKDTLKSEIEEHLLGK